MAKKEAQKNIVIPLASVGGGSGVIAFLIWLVSQFGQVEANSAELISGKQDHKVINAQISALQVDMAETRTRSSEQHKETLRRFDDLAQMIRDIKE